MGRGWVRGRAEADDAGVPVGGHCRPCCSPSLSSWPPAAADRPGPALGGAGARAVLGCSLCVHVRAQERDCGAARWTAVAAAARWAPRRGGLGFKRRIGPSRSQSSWSESKPVKLFRVEASQVGPFQSQSSRSKSHIGPRRAGHGKLVRVGDSVCCPRRWRSGLRVLTLWTGEVAAVSLTVSGKL